MTTREWFRILRGELWKQHARNSFPADIDRVATFIVEGNDPLRGVEWVRVGPFYLTEHPESALARAAAVEAVRQDMRRAMRRLAAMAGMME